MSHDVFFSKPSLVLQFVSSLRSFFSVQHMKAPFHLYPDRLQLSKFYIERMANLELFKFKPRLERIPIKFKYENTFSNN